jgi:methionyl-tRNA formyltransferase
LKKNKQSAIKVVFMGTPEFAVTILKTILDNDIEVVGVITAADKPAGRGRKMHQSAVKKFALENDLNILQPRNLKAPDFQKELAALNADLQVVVAFRMLPKSVWDMPKYGTFNLHASLLPEYRGAAPINWAIINGESKSGVTTFFIDEKIDTGEIILQEEVSISETDSAGILHDKLMHLGSDLVIKTINAIAIDTIKTKKQPNRELKSAPKLYKETCKIDWTDSLENIYNKVRGLSPYPVAWTELQHNDKLIELKIHKAKKSIEDHNFIIGQIMATKKEIRIAVKDGFLIIEDIQLSGKKRMDARSFLNGFAFNENSKVL